MRDDDVILLLALGALVVTSEPIEWGDGWVWPVQPLIAGPSTAPRPYQPDISQEWRYPDHLGVDIMYRRRSPDDLATAYPVGHDGTAKWFAPPQTPIVAARDGTLWSAGTSPRGFSVVIDHGRPFATFYQHLALLSVPLAAEGKILGTGQSYPVKAGDVIGTMGYDPTDPEELRHLHFAVWYNGAGDNASVDPATAMQAWKRAQPWRAT